MDDRSASDANEAASPISDDGVMAGNSDEAYARTLLTILQRDQARLDNDLEWASVVIWVAEDVRREAGRLSIPSDLAADMRKTADKAMKQVRAARDSRAA